MSLFNLSLFYKIRSYHWSWCHPTICYATTKEMISLIPSGRDWVACIVSFSSSLGVILAESWNLSTEQKCKRFFCLLCLLLKFLQEWLGRFNELSSPLEFFDLFNTICCASHFSLKTSVVFSHLSKILLSMMGLLFHPKIPKIGNWFHKSSATLWSLKQPDSLWNLVYSDSFVCTIVWWLKSIIFILSYILLLQ